MHQALLANRFGTMFDVCERLVPVLCRCPRSYYTGLLFAARKAIRHGCLKGFEGDGRNCTGIDVHNIHFLSRALQLVSIPFLKIVLSLHERRFIGQARRMGHSTRSERRRRKVRAGEEKQYFSLPLPSTWRIN